MYKTSNMKYLQIHKFPFKSIIFLNIECKSYLKILQKLRCLVAFQNRLSAPIGRDENFVNFEFFERQFRKEKPRFVHKSAKHWFWKLSLFCLTFEDFYLGLTFSLGPRDPKRFGRAKWGLGTRQEADILQRSSLARVQRSTMGRKIWLSIHPRHFGFDKIVLTHLHPFM